MKEINGILVERFPLSGLNRFYDLWEYDGPLLSHVTDDAGDNFLFYWVDNDDDFNRWLIWAVDFDTVIDYINKELDFSTVFKSSKFYFSADVNDDLAYTNVKILQIGDIPLEYIPEVGLFYVDDVPDVYIDKMISFSPGHVQRLRRNGCSFKLKKAVDGAPISTKDGGLFLTAVDESVKAYAVNDYLIKERDNIVDISHFHKKIVPLLKEACQTLIVDNKYGSFEVVLNVETLQKVDESLSIATWKRQIISNYYTDVIDIDYNSTSGQDSLISKFPDATVRRTIIKPIADFLKKSECKFVSHQVGNNRLKIHEKLTNKSYDRLELKSAKVEDDPETSSTFVSMIVQVGVKNGQAAISKQAIDKGMLFQEQSDMVKVSFQTVKNSDYQINFKQAVLVEVRIIENGTAIAESNIPHVSSTGKTSNDALASFEESLITFIVKLEVSTRNEDKKLYEELVNSLTLLK